MAPPPLQVTSARDVLAQIDAGLAESREAGRATGLILIQIDRLNELRISVGLAAAEQLQMQLDQRLQGLARSRDRVLRISDDQRVLLVPMLMNPGQVELAAGKILREIDACRLASDHSIALQSRLGVAVDDVGKCTAEALLRHAQAAISLAARKGETVGHAHDLTEIVAESDIRLEAEIERGLGQGEFEIWCQPKLDLVTRLPVGAEGLVRWRHPSRGLVPPDEFLPTAERSGRIVQLTWSALNIGLQQLTQWPASCGDTGIAINVSASCLYQAGFVHQVLDALSIWSVPPQRLTIEVTETVAMTNAELSDRVLRTLREAGVRVSIDDFGSGYSSLSYFKRLPADEIKIDRAFIQDLIHDDADRHIVATIIELSRRFGLNVVAEGIEDEATLECVATMGCDVAQGYLIARPMPHEQIIDYLAQAFGTVDSRAG
ncbi:MAG: GGDEF domain-containing protein [Gammaproteobacteria bacterium]|nr:GGDEF domain-containing protein [Gammaproteobacteria bacterium]